MGRGTAFFCLLLSSSGNAGPEDHRAQSGEGMWLLPQERRDLGDEGAQGTWRRRHKVFSEGPREGTWA